MKKKKKTKLPSKPSDSTPFAADPLVEGDCPAFNNLRVFTSKNDSVVYSFREHFLYFPWENKKSKSYSTACPPASFHLERRSDLKGFNFYDFRKNKSRVNLYRYARDNYMCDDLLEYISENVETLARFKFQQHLTELRESKIIKHNSIQETKFDNSPLFPKRSNLIGHNFVQIHYHSKKSVLQQNDEFNSFLSWYNNLDDKLVDEVRTEPDFISLSFNNEINQSEILEDQNYFLNFNNNEFEIRTLVKSLLRRYFQHCGTKFKMALAASPGFGKTYLRNLFASYNITDLDDISMLDPILGPQFHKLVNARKWNEQKKLYESTINTRFKEGLLLIQNQGQIPSEIPTLSIITAGPLNRKKLWSDRSLFDTIRKSRYKVFVHSKSQRNRITQIIFDELYNSDNYQ